MTARLVIADDHPILLEGLKNLIKSGGPFDIVAAVGTGDAALDAITREQPDFAILDLKMPGMGGIDVLRASAAVRPNTRIILLAASATDGEIVAAVDYGAVAIVFKDEAPTKLVGLLKDLADGRPWEATETISAALVRERSRQGTWRTLSAALTEREREVVNLTGHGRSNKDIAQRLQLSEGTVKVHLHNVFRKLGVGTRSELIALIARAESG